MLEVSNHPPEPIKRGCSHYRAVINHPQPMKEYKVITQDDEWFSGRFDGKLLETLINQHARQGWIVKSMVSASREGVLFGGNKDELLILLERRAANRSRTTLAAIASKVADDLLDPEAEETAALEREEELDRVLAEINATISDPAERKRLKLRAIADYS